MLITSASTFFVQMRQTKNANKNKKTKRLNLNIVANQKVIEFFRVTLWDFVLIQWPYS